MCPCLVSQVWQDVAKAQILRVQPFEPYRQAAAAGMSKVSDLVRLRYQVLRPCSASMVAAWCALMAKHTRRASEDGNMPIFESSHSLVLKSV